MSDDVKRYINGQRDWSGERIAQLEAENAALQQQLSSLKGYCEERAQELGWPGYSQGSDPAAYLFDRIVEQQQQLEREMNRADCWVRAARDLARELGLPDDESGGGSKDWSFIIRKVGKAKQ